MKEGLMAFAMSSMDSLQHWFFWTWKIAPSSVDNSVRAPLWSYKLGLDNGWIPTNPRNAIGHCVSLGVAQDTPFDGTFEPWQTGGGDGALRETDLARYGAWPPPSVGVAGSGSLMPASLLPTYTATGTIPTLSTYPFPAPTPSASFDGGDGWFNSADTAPGLTTVAGCSYPNPWDATAAAVPAAVCTGAPARRKREPIPQPIITPL